MKKLTVLALVATLGLAAPAFAQTPADIKNFRDATKTVVAEIPATPVVVKETTAKKSVKKSTKKAVKKTVKTSAANAKAEVKKDAKEEMHDKK